MALLCRLLGHRWATCHAGCARCGATYEAIFAARGPRRRTTRFAGGIGHRGLL